MRIGHYAPRLWAPGGIATYVRRLGTALRLRGHDVRYYTRHLDESAPETTVVDDDAALFAQAQADGVDVLHLHKPVSVLPDDCVPTVRTMHGNQGSCPSGTRFLKRTGSPCPRAYHPLGCLWGHLVDHCGSRRPGKIRANFAQMQHEHDLAAQIPTLTVSQFVRDAMIRSGCPAEQLRVIPSPAPPVRGEYHPPPMDGPPRIAYVGRLASEKGVDWLLDAAAQVPEVHVDVAGSGDPDVEAALRRQVDDLGMSGRVYFHGWVGEDTLNAIYACARAVVVPSTWHEPAGLVTLEAAGRGRAVIASAVGGIPEYARPEFALLADPGDVDGLAAHLRTLAEDYTYAAALGKRGRDLMQTTFSMDVFLDRLTGVYERLVAEPRTAVGGGVSFGFWVLSSGF